MRARPGRWRRAGAAGLVALAAGCAEPPPAPRAVVVAYPSTAATLHPLLASDEFSYSITSNVFEPLVDVDAQQALRPGLAVAWHSLDDLTWRFELRAGARFHDGRPLDAERVVASLEQARLDPALRAQTTLEPIAGFFAVDERQIEVRTRFPVPDLAARLTEIGVWIEAQPPGAAPLGSGPYRIASFVPGGEVALERVAGNGPERLVFRAMPEAAERQAALRRGEVDLIGELPASEAAALGQAPRVRVIESRGLRVLFLGFNCEARERDDMTPRANPFRDRRVRRAVALGIDREALVKEPLGGLAEVLDQPLAPEVFGYASGLERLGYDPEEARRLLAEAGVTGFETALDFVPGKYRDIERVVEAVVADLGRLDIRVKPRPSSYPQYLERLDRRDTPFYVRGWSTSVSAAHTYDYLLHSPRDGYGSSNAGGYSNPDLDALLATARREADDAKRLQALRRGAEIVRRDMPLVPLYRQFNLYAAAAGLDFQPRLDRTVRGVELAWREQTVSAP